MEDAPLDSKSPLAAHTRQEMERQIAALSKGTASSLVVRGPDILHCSGEPHELYASTHHYCVLALHQGPLASLVSDPRLPGTKVLCPRCQSGKNTSFKE